MSQYASIGVPPSREDLAKRENELIDNASAPATNRARRCQANCYEQFCDSYNLDYLPCGPQRISTYVAYLSFFLVYSSILNYLSGLSFYLKSRGKDGIDFTNFCIRSALNGARRMCGKGRGKSTGLFPKDLLCIFAKLDMSIFNNLVFWAATTLAFRCLLRASNYCKSRHSLMVDDLLFVKEGIVVKISSSKTNQFNEYVSEIPIFANSDSPLCPVKWICKMLSIRRPARGDNLFLLSIKGNWKPMSAVWFNKMLKMYCTLPKVSSHSLRRGGASYMLQLKFKLPEVKQRGLWKSACVFEYLSLRTDQAMVRDKIFSLSLPQ